MKRNFSITLATPIAAFSRRQQQHARWPGLVWTGPHSVSPSAAEPDGAVGDQCWASSVFPGRRLGSKEKQSGTERPGGPEELALPVHPAPLPGEAGQEQQGSKSVIFHRRLCLYVQSVWGVLKVSVFREPKRNQIAESWEPQTGSQTSHVLVWVELLRS